MEDYYEINVTFNGKHLFATAPRSIRTWFELQKVLNIFVRKFKVTEGYDITITKWEGRGYDVSKREVLGG